jgi:hypothetical protein
VVGMSFCRHSSVPHLPKSDHTCVSCHQCKTLIQAQFKKFKVTLQTQVFVEASFGTQVKQGESKKKKHRESKEKKKHLTSQSPSKASLQESFQADQQPHPDCTAVPPQAVAS